MKVAIQGAAGSFHEMAARQFYGESAQLLYCRTFTEVFNCLQNGASNEVMLAIGNSRYGDINHVYEALIKNHRYNGSKKYWISGEVYLPIRLCLLGVKGAKLKNIREVHSQAPAFGQCFLFLHEKLPEATVIEQDDTAESAKLVSGWGDPVKAAIASEAAARLYGLEVLDSQIQDDPKSYTRFVVISNKGAETSKGDKQDTKSSLMLRVKHDPGSLAEALICFGDENVGLSYIQSVPIPAQPFKYHFYVDIEAGADDPRTKRAFEALVAKGHEVDVLGSYTKANLPL